MTIETIANGEVGSSVRPKLNSAIAGVNEYSALAPKIVRAPETISALPAAASRAGKLFGFDASGNPSLVNATAGGTVSTADIVDAGATGRAILQAATQTAAQAAIGLTLDFVVLSFAGAATPSAGSDLTTQWDAAVTLANSTGRTLLVRGDGAFDRRWFKLQPGRAFPTRADVIVQGSVGIRATTASDILFNHRGRLRISGDLLLDGGLEAETVSGGFLSGHIGLRIMSTTYGTTIADVSISDVSTTNFGQFGFETYFLDEAVISDCGHQRIGQAGEAHWSPRNMRRTGGRIKNIFPGESAADWQRNAYGITFSQYTGDRQASGIIDSVTVEDVVTWTGIDTHSSSAVTVRNCTVINCSQGIAAENHIAGVRINDFRAHGNRIIGFSSGSVTKDGLTCYSVAGIVANSADALPAERVQIYGNQIESCGERRPGVVGGAAIAVRNARALNINGNSIRIAMQAGIALLSNDTTQSATDEILNSIVTGNVIDGVVSHASTQRGVYVYPFAQGVARANLVNSAGTAATSYARAGSAVYSFNFGVVGGYADTSASNIWN